MWKICRRHVYMVPQTVNQNCVGGRKKRGERNGGIATTTCSTMEVVLTGATLMTTLISYIKDAKVQVKWRLLAEDYPLECDVEH